MPQFDSTQSNGDNGDRLPKKHSCGGLLSRYGSGGLPDKRFIETRVVTSAVEVKQWNARYEQEDVQETAPLAVISVECTSRSLQVQPGAHYISLAIPLRNVQTGAVTVRNVVYQPMRRSPLVIPAARTGLRETEELHLQDKHLHPLMRLGLLFLSTLCVFLICMLTLTQMGQGLAGGSLFSWTSVPRSSWNLLSRDTTNGGTNSSTNVTAGSVVYYQRIAQVDALKYGIPPDLYVRQIQQESHFDPNAFSYAGAIGIAQFEPDTAALYHINPRDPIQALDGGAHFMSDLNKMFGGDYRKALAAYNAGAGAVDNAVMACGAAWLSCMDGQPQAYVAIIIGY